jgi:hypothetical protein
MLWLRVLIGVIVTALLATAIWTVSQQFGGASTLMAGDAPGIGASDKRALEAPIDSLLAGRDEEILTSLIGEIDRAQAQEQIELIQGLVPPGTPESSRLTNWRVTHTTNGQALNGSFEYGYADHIMLAQSSLSRARDGEPWLVSGFHVNVFERSDLPPQGVSFEGKATGFYVFMAALLAIPVFILATLWAVLLWKRVRRRWLWGVAVTIGLGTFAVNATTGAWSFNFLSFLLFGAAATWSGSVLDSWVLSIALPLGAIAFWLVHLLAPPPAPVEADAA